MDHITSTVDVPRSLQRRHWLAGTAALGLSAALGMTASQAQTAIRKGGTLRVGMEGGSPSDSLDPRTYADSIPIFCSLMFWNQLVEIDSKGNATPELAESWESRPGAAEWIFNIRKGVTFGSGKTLDADDVIYSINLHRGETKSPARGILEPITDIRKLSSHQIQITMKTGNADLPFVLSDYHLIIVPAGTSDFSKPDGTGAYSLVEWQPGVRVSARRKPGNYWKPNRGNFDSVEVRYIGDSATRTQALVSGQVDAVNRLNPKTVALLAKNPAIKVSRTKGTGNRYGFVALLDTDPYRSRDVMLGLKHGIDRQKIIDNVFSGYATLGNDQTVGPADPFYNAALKPKPYDPDRAKFHFRKAGLSSPLEVQVSDGCYTGAIDSGVLYREHLAKAGVNLQVKRVSGDGYWDNVWMKAPFCSVFWGNRPTADLQISLQFLGGGAWNDTRFKSPAMDKLVIDARVELNQAKRREMYAEAQRIISEEAGMVCFGVGDQMDGGSAKLMGLEPHARYDMSDNRLAEKGWFA